MSCERYKDELVEYALGEADSRVRARVEAHLTSCGRCSAEVAEYVRVIETLREADRVSSRVRRDKQFRDRCLNKIQHRRRAVQYQSRGKLASRAPLIAALSTAAIFLVAIIYILATQDSRYRGIREGVLKFPQAKAPESARDAGEVGLPLTPPVQEPAQQVSQPEDTAPPQDTTDKQAEPAPGRREGTEPPVRVAEESEEITPVPFEDFPKFDPATEEVGKPSQRRGVAKLMHVRGQVQLKRKDTEDWAKAGGEEILFAGDSIKTGSRDSSVLCLTVCGTAVLDRGTSLMFKSFNELELQKGEVLASSRYRPLSVDCGAVRVFARGSDACIRQRSKETRLIAVRGSVLLRYGKEKKQEKVVSERQGVVVRSGAKIQELKKLEIEKELGWLASAGPKFRLWIEGECCCHEGFAVIQRGDKNLSNRCDLHKSSRTASLWWRVKLPYNMPCYVWVRYSRPKRASEKIGLFVNHQKIGEKKITKAGFEWVWVKAFKVTLGRRNLMKLYFTSKKPATSRVDLILITNDADFTPPLAVPKGGYYGNKEGEAGRRR